MKSMLIFLINYLRCRYLLLSGGSREASLSICYSLLARGEAESDNGGRGYDIAERSLVRVSNHEAFRTSFGTKRFYYCVLHSRKINQHFQAELSEQVDLTTVPIHR